MREQDEIALVWVLFVLMVQLMVVPIVKQAAKLRSKIAFIRFQFCKKLLICSSSMLESQRF